MVIVWTKHAENRQKEWEKKRGISRQEVEMALLKPEQIIPGDQGVLIAQVRREMGLLRIPFVEDKHTKRILTLYWTSKIEKYWQEPQQ